MTFDDLEKRRMIEKTTVSDDEIAEHLRLSRHDIALARTLSTQDLDWSFNIAYNGILQASIAYMAHAGYRARGKAKHYNTFVFMELALPPVSAASIGRVQKMRAKRNVSVYDMRGAISAKEGRDILDFSEGYLEEISGLLPASIVKLSQSDGEDRT